MMKTSILALTLTTLVVISTAQFCPSSSSKGTVFSANIIAALQGGDFPISEIQDSKCYNYTLASTFNSPPDVAIAVNSFDSQPSYGLYFYIKSIRSSSLSILPFVIRTQWPYTKWNQISFSFIAQDRVDIDTGYYQLDTGSLAGCDNGKSVDILLPFRTIFGYGQQIKYNLFLHGFQISTTLISGNTRSPFEIQIVASSSNVSGIAVSLSVTTVTQVNSVYISYLAFQNTALSVVGGNFVYDRISNPGQTLYYAPENSIPKNYARLYGITGFLLNYNRQKLTLRSTWDGYSFNFQIGTTTQISLLQYFSFSFIFFTGSECQDCPGYTIFYGGSCVNYCPAGTAKTNENTCTNCGSGREWNGTACVITCPSGQYLNPSSNLCQCPPTLNWNGQSCIVCQNGQVFNASKKVCQCPQPSIFNGYSCVKMDACSNGKVWDVFEYTCKCSDITWWNGYQCVSIPQCQGGQTLNSLYQCVCPYGYVWGSNSCIVSPCIGGQIWTGSTCVCPAGQHFNRSMCLQCINGQKWNANNLTCSCEPGYEWNGGYCTVSYSCSNGRVWSAQYNNCICPNNYYWAGYACLAVPECTGGQYFDSAINKCVCLSNFQWNGRTCVQCDNGRTWNVTSLSCSCPVGTVQSQNGCNFVQQCTGGKQWNQNKWSCDCPQTSVWNGAYCIANACTNGRTWNQTLKACQCMGNKVWINDTCVPPQIGCTNGQVWNQYIYACQCPQSTYNAGTSCVSIPVCTNGKVYNPLNNQCQCPFGLVANGSGCSTSSCPTGQYYNSNTCQVINCPPPSYFSVDRCVYGGNNQCNFGYFWNGNKCVYYPISCPEGTTWNTTTLTCQNSGPCGYGYYISPSGGCLPLPQQCAPPTKWDGQKCSVSGSCPNGTYFGSNACQPYNQCSNGYTWDTFLLRCVCPSNSIDTGNRCVQCPNQQKWSPSSGCSCPQGTFDSGATCESPNSSKCNLIVNAIWSSNQCVCRPGFTRVGYQCVCYGTQTGSLCDRCSYKPNSEYIPRSGTCECKSGYIEIRGQCVRSGQQSGNDDPQKCTVGTYFDQSHKMCLACPDGCLSCKDCYTCNICRPQFFYDSQSSKCIEFCGDGKKFFAACDDGNNQDGDGCSRDCKIQSGYTCTGGSSSSKDNCYVYRPSSVTIETVGQIRMSSSIILNVKLNYFPASLLQSTQCSNKCNQILTGTIIDGDKAVSIVSQYVTGTSYVFTMTVQFGRSYMGNFKIKIGVNSAYTKYFGSINLQTLEVTIQPSYLLAVSDKSESLS